MKVYGSADLRIVRFAGVGIGRDIGNEVDSGFCDKAGEVVELDIGVKVILIHMYKMN